MRSGVKVVDAMTVRPVVASPQMTVHDVAVLMDRYNVGSVLIKSGDELLGIVTERDYVCRACLEGADPLTTQVSRIMTRDLITVSPGMDLWDALLIMKDSEVRHLPVLDEGKFVGFITAKDILKVQPQLFENYVDHIELREEDRKLRARETTIDFDDYD